jgi:hypothetical protein
VIEVHALPAPSEQDRRLAWCVFAVTVRRMLAWGVLGPDALKMLRQDLRVGDWRAATVPDSHWSQHVELLHDVTEAWAAGLDPAMRDYFVALGDLLPSAPDTPEGLTP